MQFRKVTGNTGIGVLVSLSSIVLKRRNYAFRITQLNVTASCIMRYFVYHRLHGKITPALIVHSFRVVLLKIMIIINNALQ